MSGLRARPSNSRAQNGEATAHNNEEVEKMAATIESAMPIERRIDGSTDCNPVLPIAVINERQKMMTNEGRENLGTSDIWHLAKMELAAGIRDSLSKSIHLAMRASSVRNECKAARSTVYTSPEPELYLRSAVFEEVGHPDRKSDETLRT